jgi:hypothetical protein
MKLKTPAACTESRLFLVNTPGQAQRAINLLARQRLCRRRAGR